MQRESEIRASRGGKDGVRGAPVPATPRQDAVLALQRSAGNRAVADLVTLARAPVTTEAQFRAGVPDRGGGGTAQEVALGQLEGKVRRRLRRYNRVATDNTQLAARIRLLGELDDHVYRWFGALASTDFDTEPRALFMRDLMEELDAEHVNVVRAAAAAGVVPVYGAGLSVAEQTRAAALWTSVSSGAGSLQIEGGGDAAFEQKTLSSIAKMLHTGTGRDVIGFLDRPPPPPGGAPPGVTGANLPVHPGWGMRLTGYETFIIPETRALQQAGIAGATGTGESSANRPLSQVHGAGAGQSGYTKLLAPPAVLADYPVVADAAQYNRALLGGRPGFAIAQGGATEYYAFGTGEGNAIVMQYGQFARGLGAGNVEVISPDFVLLAHEMGHAVRVRGGGYAADEQFGWFGVNMPTWQNRAEEMSNVIGIENPVRQESGITERSTYNTWKFAVGMPQLTNLQVTFGNVLGDLRNAGFTDAEVWDWAKTQPATKKFFLLGYSGWGPLSVAEGAERTALKDRLSSPLLNEARGGGATFYDDFIRSKLPTLLRPYLKLISDDDDAKTGSLMAGLSNAEQIQALAYLHGNRNALNAVKVLMHFGSSARRGTTDAKRAAARLAALRTLIAPGGTIAAAQTQKTTVSTT